MFRYFAITWNVLHPGHAQSVRSIFNRIGASRNQWTEIFSGDGLRVFYACNTMESAKAIALPQGSGAILGTVFNRIDEYDDVAAHRTEISTETARRFVATRGKELVDLYWGNYVALLLDSANRLVCAIKDPTGNLPCLTADIQGVRLFFSYVGDFIDLRVSRLTIDWEYPKAALQNRAYGRCLLGELQEVSRGECFEIDHRTTPSRINRKSLWNPLKFSNPAQSIEDADQAATALRCAVRQCVSAWASGHSKFLLRLSGGLDSSIVLGCLKDVVSPDQVVAYTEYPINSSTDERRWARLAAQHAHYELVEHPLDFSKIKLRRLFQQNPTVTVPHALSYLEQSKLEQSLATERGITAVFSGDGGDSSFGSLAIRYAADDFVRRHGLTRRALRLSSEVALIRGLSAWTVLSQALTTRRFGFRESDTRLGEELKLLNAEVLNSDSCDKHTHPWFSSCSETPWPTIMLLGELLSTPTYYDLFTDPIDPYPELLTPLYSQPTIEICLRIPSYIHFERGRSRGLARRAFRSDASPQNLRRSWKERVPSTGSLLVRNNISLIREVLLDGFLVKNRLLNRKAVDEGLSSKLLRSEATAGELLNAFDMEVWLGLWDEKCRNFSAVA